MASSEQPVTDKDLAHSDTFKQSKACTADDCYSIRQSVAHSSAFDAVRSASVETERATHHNVTPRFATHSPSSITKASVPVPALPVVRTFTDDTPPPVRTQSPDPEPPENHETQEEQQQLWSHFWDHTIQATK